MSATMSARAAKASFRLPSRSAVRQQYYVTENAKFTNAHNVRFSHLQDGTQEILHQSVRILVPAPIYEYDYLRPIVPKMPRVFLITGTSTGFGNHLVQEVLDKGDICVATARKPESLSFQNASEKNYLAVKLDVTKAADIDSAFKATLDKFGRVDVVVNNAGYGLGGPFEELKEDQIRTQMEVNFFGLTAVTRKAMEVMRDQKPSGGLIQQVTSIGGQRGVPMFSIYCASKWAVEGFTEAISHEVKPEWNIKFTCVEPGGFRTDWAGRSMAFSEKKHPAYDHIDAKQAMGDRHGTQAGDPIKGSKAMYELAVMKDPPLRVVIGSDAYTAIMGKIDAYGKNYKKYEQLSNGTDVEGYKRPS